MRTTYKKITAFFLASFIMAIMIPTTSLAKEPAVATITITNNNTGAKQTVKMNTNVMTTKTFRSNDSQSTDECDVYVKIPENGDGDIQIMDAKAYRASSSTDSNSEQNTYWKAKVSITYSADGTYCDFSKAAASWTQLRGNSSLSDREVYWGYTLGISSGGKTYYPTSNSVSYKTNLGRKKYGTTSLIGCNSSVLITLEHGSTITLEANIERSL